MRFFGYIYISENITIYIFPRPSLTYARCLLTVYGVYNIIYSWQVLRKVYKAGAGDRCRTTCV